MSANICVIGGTGHIGSYLVPRLVSAGHEVTVISRGASTPYIADPRWAAVRRIALDRSVAEPAGEFGRLVAAVEADVVIDLICFNRESAEMLARAVHGRVRHLLVCGTIWVHGHSEVVPTREDQKRQPFGEYGVSKAQMEDRLLHLAHTEGLPVTIIHPGHIVGEGWSPLNPEGHFDNRVWRSIKSGRTITLPNIGLETVHHVHADDVARLFLAAMHRRSGALGESFHAVSPQAVTLRGYAEAAYRWFGKEPEIRYLPWEELKAGLSEIEASQVWDHIAHSPCCSMEKARRILDYTPAYGSLDAVRQSVAWLEREGQL
ncbi:MAG: NAD-dependent epimerase/dehydratase family protein [Spirochaetaceae bacterium]|nr:MAG: NAD-dependent epimerase/dehydratase family protein [Spirochaetaceae bacterium]